MPDMPIIPIQAAVLRAPGRPLKIERLEMEGPRGGLGTGIGGWFRVGQASNGRQPGSPRQRLVKAVEVTAIQRGAERWRS
jgi:hypothetical protein